MHILCPHVLYNFIGVLIGPGGGSLADITWATGAKICIRGNEVEVQADGSKAVTATVSYDSADAAAAALFVIAVQQFVNHIHLFFFGNTRGGAAGTDSRVCCPGSHCSGSAKCQEVWQRSWATCRRSGGRRSGGGFLARNSFPRQPATAEQIGIVTDGIGAGVRR